MDFPGFIPGMAKLFLLHRVQIASGTHPASYLKSIGDDFPSGKAAGA
jgi:hypothetical protein